jgi:hypothetical protein
VNLLVPYSGKFVEQMSDYHLLNKNLGIYQIHEDIVMHKLRRLDVHEN